MARRSLIVCGILVGAMALPSVALACGGLVAPDGAVNLARTTTLAAYVDGVEHYITAFEFTGLGGAKFGSIVPLPGKPTKVQRAGDWTLQRLLREVQPPVLADVAFSSGAPASVPAPAVVILETKIDALDITVLEGGAASVAEWARLEGFELSPDAPEVLEFYAARSRYFMATRFDAKRAAKLGQTAGDSTPIHVTIPIDQPWVPLRILSLGRFPGEIISADVFLLTEAAPAMLPVPRGAGLAAGLPVAKGLRVERSERARGRLLRDLASDKGMKWLPTRDMWLSYLRLDAPAASLGYDLAIDPTGRGLPSWRAAGFPRGLAQTLQNPVAGPVVQVVREPVPVPVAAPAPDRTGWLAAALLLSTAVGVAIVRRLTLPT